MTDARVSTSKNVSLPSWKDVSPSAGLSSVKHSNDPCNVTDVRVLTSKNVALPSWKKQKDCVAPSAGLSSVNQLNNPCM